jgi:AmmeMemoRadiSam system protein A
MENFIVTDYEKEFLLTISKNALFRLFHFDFQDPNRTNPSIPFLGGRYGAFVSIYNSGTLRGCLGQFTTDQIITELINHLTISTALNDRRFTPIRKEEVKDLTIEISVLSPLKKINDIQEIQLGKHGIYIKKGNMSGTFLPQVASKTNWTLDEFLGHCSRDKAGIGWDGWKNAEVSIYEAIIFQGDMKDAPLR